MWIYFVIWMIRTTPTAVKCDFHVADYGIKQKYTCTNEEHTIYRKNIKKYIRYFDKKAQATDFVRDFRKHEEDIEGNEKYGWITVSFLPVDSLVVGRVNYGSMLINTTLALDKQGIIQNIFNSLMSERRLLDKSNRSKQ